jgi:outer membrane protein assembly factor BamE (lipoprotein component of BamABCDE complex)
MDHNHFSRYFVILFILSLFFFISCSTARVIKQQDVAKIAVGQTTKQEVVAALGLPNQRAVEGENERWLYFKEATQTTTNLATLDSFKQTYKTGVPIVQYETNIQGFNPNVAAIIWLDKYGVVCKLIQGELK